MFVLAAIVVLAVAASACSQPGTGPEQTSTPADNAAPADAQHEGITDPHGDHSPHHGGLVLMNGDVHYEVVLGANGRHALWLTNAIREDLPASIASNVRLVVTRPDAPPESLAMAIDDAGESWIATGKPLEGPDIMVTVSYELLGELHEVEIPYGGVSGPQVLGFAGSGSREPASNQ